MAAGRRCRRMPNRKSTTLDVASKSVALQKFAKKKISPGVFDRNGFIYHGRVKAVADGAREGGLDF